MDMEAKNNIKPRKKYTRSDGLSTEERFWSKVDKTADCWVWKAGKNQLGYGRFYFDKQLSYAHRFSFKLIHGELSADLCVCHRCDNPACVRPDHLFLGTHKDNCDDKHAKGRDSNGKEKQTHCKRGHELSGENIWTFPSNPNRRVCRVCQRNSNTEYARAKRARLKLDRQNFKNCHDKPIPK